MTRSSKIFFIILEFVFGIGFGILGAIVFAMFGNEGHLYSVRFIYIAMYLSALLGIGIIGYFYLRRISRVGDFSVSILLSFFGMIIFYLVLHFVFGLLVRETLITKATPQYLGIISLLLPIVGAIIGFNYKTRHVIRNGTNK
jgi:hypothetical protein